MNIQLKFLAVATPVALSLLLVGCGGGGGGSSSPPSGPRQLLFDDFSGSALDANLWGNYSSDQQLQRTRYGFNASVLTEGSTNFARLRLDSFNPDYNGQFKGTEIFTHQRFARGDGLEIEARLRAPNLPPGIIFAFFSIYDRFNGTPSNATYLKDEIDFEFLTAQEEQFTPRNQRNKLYLNIWKDWNVRYGYDGNDIDDGADTERMQHTDKTYRSANYDYANWNTYKIRWLPDRTQYFLNGNLERTELEVNPSQPMAVHFNMWTGTPDFQQAYSSSLQPAASAAANRSYFFDVDYLRVSQLGKAVTTANIAPAQPLPAVFKSYRNR